MTDILAIYGIPEMAVAVEKMRVAVEANTATLQQFMLQQTQLGEMEMVRTDDLVAKVQGMGDALGGLVTVVHNFPNVVREAMTQAVAEGDLDDAQKQAVIDNVVTQIQGFTDTALAAAAEGTGTTLPDPEPVPENPTPSEGGNEG